jgi:BT1 family
MSVLLAASGLLSSVLYSRVNKQWGVPDDVLAIVIQIPHAIINYWVLMPGVMLMSQLCPQGMEASVYALMYGAQSVAESVSHSLGAFLLERLEITPNGTNSDASKFDNLWLASIICALAPLLSILIIRRCVPDALQTDTILSGYPTSATAGSPWEKYRGFDRREASDSTELESCELAEI